MFFGEFEDVSGYGSDGGGGVGELFAVDLDGAADDELFLQLVARQGGDTAFLENTASYPASNHEVDVLSHQSGFVTGVDTFSLGVVATELGAGRLKVDDTINPKAGIQIKKKIGDQIEIEEPIAVIHADNSNIVAPAADRVRSAFAIGNERPGLPSLIQALVDQKGVHDWTTPVLY